MTQKLNLAGKITKIFLYNRPLTLLVLIGTILSGVLAYNITPKQYNPEITLPAFQVTVNYPGANAEEVENFVTRELEEKITDIQGVDTIHSQSIDGGISIVNVTFHIGEDLETSKVKLQTQLSEHSELALGKISQPHIKNINPDNVPILSIGFQSDTLTQNEVRTQVVHIMNELKRLEGVANLEVHGGEKRALRIILNPQSMKLRKVSVRDVQNAIQSNNIKSPSGHIKNEENTWAIEVNGTFYDKQSAENIFVVPGVKLSDIAKIEDAYTEKNSFVYVDRKEIKNTEFVFLSIAKQKGSNAIEISKSVKKKLESLLTNMKYKELKWEIFRDEGRIAEKEINGLGKNLITSIIIVSLVLFAFLGLRAALVVAIAIPLTLSLVFLFAYLFGETINRITLFALILSLGLLVDSATVVVENIFRHIQKGDEKKEAIVQAVNEVGMGLFLSTLTSVIVFLPTSQITGMMGEYMGPLSFFVPLALIMSLFVAYILTPFLANILIPSHKELCNIEHEKVCKKDFFDKISDWYAIRLSGLLHSKKKQKKFLLSTFGALILVFSFPVIQLVHFKMLPTADKEQYYIYIDAPEGTNSPETQKIAQRVSGIALENPEVLSVQNFVGQSPIVDFNGLFKGAHLREGTHLATLRVNLSEPQNRWIKSEEIVKKTRKALYEDVKISEYRAKGLDIRILEDPPGPPVQATLVAKVKGPEKAQRTEILKALEEKLPRVKGVVDIQSSQEKKYLRTIFHIDHEKALASGVSVSDVAETLRAALSPIQVDQYHIPEQNEFAFIEMQFAKEFRDEIQDLSQIYIKNYWGEMLPLSSIALEKNVQNEPFRYRDEQTATEYISAELERRSIVYASIDLIYNLVNHYVPENSKLLSWNLFGIEYENNNGDIYSVEWGGEWKMTLENFRDLGLAMIVAFLLIYAVLVAQFRSFGAPGLIMLTIPLAFLGILPGFAFLDLLFGTYLTATTLIGFIALMGIVVNNAIIYLEYFDQLQAEGKSLETSLIEAGRTRLRPILLTSITTVLGSLTIAGDPVWSGLAWSIVFGLSLSALLTLGVFPTLYCKVQPKRK